MKTFVAILLVVFSSLPMIAHAQDAAPRITVTVAEAYAIVFKDGGAVPGTITTRLMLGVGWKVGKFVVGPAVGVLTPNTDFKPAPRGGIMLGYSLTERVLLSTLILYQYNPSYSEKPDGHVLGATVGPTYKIWPVSIGLDLGTAKVLQGGPWSIFFQPRASITF